MIARVALAVVAVVLLAWLGVMERDTRLQAQGQDLATRANVPGNFARADRDLRRARFLNPDTTSVLSRSLLYAGKDQWQRAIAAAESVLRDEPANLQAWSLLRLAAERHDPAAVRRALAAHRRLDPIDSTQR